MKKTKGEFDLYLDESGQFTEMLPGTRDKKKRGRQFPSQLGGLLVPRGSLRRRRATEVLEACFSAADLDAPNKVHGCRMSAGAAFDTVLLALVDQLQAREWRPVRLVNQERVNYGDRVSTYVNMVAELVLRLYEVLLGEGYTEVSFALCCALVVIDVDECDIMEEEEYTRRLQEYAAVAAVRRGLAPEFSRLQIANFRLGSGRSWPELQLCDLVSNGSHDNFGKLGEEAGAALRAALGGLDFTLRRRPLMERVDSLVEEGSLGAAIQALLEGLLDKDGADGAAQQDFRDRLEVIVERLADIGAPFRTPQLALLSGWVEQIIEAQRQPDLGQRLARLMLERVDQHLRQRLPEAALPTVDGFTYNLHRLCLTAANHQGALSAARTASDELDRLAGRIAGNWEHVSTLMEGLVAQAVHFTDCFHHEEAARRMEAVSAYYADLSGLFADALPAVFPETIRSELHGKALGTWMQAEMYAGLRDSERFSASRRASELAIEEFSSPADKQRQYQYRCQLETWTEDWTAARGYLARSLDLDSDDLQSSDGWEFGD